MPEEQPEPEAAAKEEVTKSTTIISVDLAGCLGLAWDSVTMG